MKEVMHLAIVVVSKSMTDESKTCSKIDANGVKLVCQFSSVIMVTKIEIIHLINNDNVGGGSNSDGDGDKRPSDKCLEKIASQTLINTNHCRHHLHHCHHHHNLIINFQTLDLFSSRPCRSSASEINRFSPNADINNDSEQESRSISPTSGRDVRPGKRRRRSDKDNIPPGIRKLPSPPTTLEQAQMEWDLVETVQPGTV